ncbi:MAG: SBBP repeat-containing protein [Calditrichia bacterium]
MKKLMLMAILFAGILVFPKTTLAQNGNFQWAIQAGGNGFDKATAICRDAAGNLILTGYFQNTATFGSTDLTSAGFRDVFIAKYDANGNFVWAQQAGGFDEDEGFGIAADGAGNITVTGYFKNTATFGDTSLTSTGSSDIFIVRYDGDGNLLWARQAGGSNLDQGNGVATDSEGNALVTGYFNLTATFGDTSFTSDGNYDVFVAKYAANGDFMWAQQAGGSFFDQGNGIATDGNGNALVTGKFSGNAAFGDTTIISLQFNTFVAKYDANGNFMWAEKAGGQPADFGSGISGAADGSSVATGYFQGIGDFGGIGMTSAGSGDIFIAKYDATGAVGWARQFGGTDLDQGFCIARDDAGDTFVSGFFAGTATFGDTAFTSIGKDVFVAKMDTDGNVLWAANGGGAGIDEGYGIVADGSGGAIVTGLFQGTATFGSNVLNSNGQDDIFIAKIGGSVTAIGSPEPQIRTFELAQNFPNPFNPVTQIRFSVTSSGPVQLTIFNLSGRKIKSLVNENLQSGSYLRQWDGTNTTGERVASGVYLYRLQSENAVQTRKMMLLK